jgi:hypothetical protein
MAHIHAGEREAWLRVLDAAAERPGSEVDDEWRWLLRELRISPDLFMCLRDVLHQGRWRSAKTPKAYIKTAVRREAFKQQHKVAGKDPLELVPATRDMDRFSVEDSLDGLMFVHDTADSIRGPDGVWRRGGGAERRYFERYDEDENGNPISLRGRLLQKVPSSLAKVVQPSPEQKDAIEKFNASTSEWHIHAKPSVRVDLVSWAELADFDEWEMRVLKYRLSETSRERALAEQPDESSRKALQAAWRRFDRTGMQRMREFAEKILR